MSKRRSVRFTLGLEIAASVRFTLGLAIAASVLAGCKDSPEATVVRTAGIEIHAIPAPATPRVGENELRIELRDADGRPIEGTLVPYASAGATVTIEAEA